MVEWRKETEEECGENKGQRHNASRCNEKNEEEKTDEEPKENLSVHK